MPMNKIAATVGFLLSLTGMMPYAAAAGIEVSLWLTGEAAWFALPGRAADLDLLHAAPLAELLASVLALGTVTVCSQCAARRDITPADVIDGIRIAGACGTISTGASRQACRSSPADRLDP